jgi:hypothetical protein
MAELLILTTEVRAVQPTRLLRIPEGAEAEWQGIPAAIRALLSVMALARMRQA